MSNVASALIWVDAVAGGGRVEIYSREVSKADALRMFASASSDTRAFEEDLTEWVATEIIGDVLYAGYFCPTRERLDEESKCRSRLCMLATPLANISALMLESSSAHCGPRIWLSWLQHGTQRSHL